MELLEQIRKLVKQVDNYSDDPDRPNPFEVLKADRARLSLRRFLRAYEAGKSFPTDEYERHWIFLTWKQEGVPQEIRNLIHPNTPNLALPQHSSLTSRSASSPEQPMKRRRRSEIQTEETAQFGGDVHQCDGSTPKRRRTEIQTEETAQVHEDVHQCDSPDPTYEHLDEVVYLS